MERQISEYVREQIEQSGKTNFTSIDAEKSVLNRLLSGRVDPEVWAMELKPSDFSNRDYAMVFKGIQNVVAQHQNVDMITVDAALSKRFPDDMKHLPAVLVDLASFDTASIGMGRAFEDHVQIVKELSSRRKAIRSFDELVAKLRDPTQDVIETLNEMQDAAEKIDTNTAEWESLGDVLLATYDYIERRQRGEIKSITTGIKNVDRLIGGFFGGELTVIGARPSVGKSAFGANVALAAAKLGFKIGIVSCEMIDIGFGQRMFSHGAWVDGMKLRKGDVDDEAWDRLAAAISDMGNLPIDFMFKTNYVEDIVKAVRRKVRRGEMDMLIVDYLQIMETRKRFDAEHLRVGYISRMLKKLATKCNIPVIALAQVNRDTDGRMPTLKDLKDSGSIEQDADGVIFLHRPSHEDDPCIDPRDKEYWAGFKERGTEYICVGVAKQRQGAIGQACVVFDPGHMHYMEISREADI